MLDVLDTPPPVPGTRRDPTAPFGIRVDAATVGSAGERGAVGPLTLVAPAGQITVVTGDSGAGKTTLLQLVAGVLRPDTGAVKVATGAGDAVPVADLDPGWWRSQLGWSAQGGALQAGTIRQNLTLGRTDLDETTLRSALQAADAAGFVDALPGGLEHRLGDGGSGLSQGQRQRLTLARALARPVPVLLLDEPTAALDEPTEQRVLAGMRRLIGGRTVVLVTHRPAPLALADQIVRLEPSDGASAEACLRPRPGHRGGEPVVTGSRVCADRSAARRTGRGGGGRGHHRRVARSSGCGGRQEGSGGAWSAPR